jgi:SAM-dependent methyltransferase
LRLRTLATRCARSTSTVDDPAVARAKVLSDPFLRQMYREALTSMVGHLQISEAGARVLEIGAAGGITKSVFPWVETSDVRAAEGVDRVVDGGCLPYEDESLDGLIAKDALHHIPDPYAHFAEVSRALKPGARAVYLEPNWNRLSRLVFTHLHPEPFDPTVQSWTRASDDPMDSNQALAFVVFVRDQALFSRRFPLMTLVHTAPTNGLAFLLSGGVHSRTPVPGGLLLRLRAHEEAAPRLLQHTGLNRLLVLEKRSG